MLTPRGKQRVMSLLLGSLLLRPYVYLFLLVFLAAGFRDLGARRTALFLAWVWPLAFVAEFASTRIGIPFGLYHYTGSTRAQELFIADVPFFDSLSFTFLAYASFSLARAIIDGHGPSRSNSSYLRLALLSGVLMMLLDVVIDPLAVRGDRWFLGRIFWYPNGGPYFGVPLSNFAGWLIVGAAGVGGYLLLAGKGAIGRRPFVGVALYYAVLAFNLVVTAWIQEWLLVASGVALHLILGTALLLTSRRPRVA
jgi:putative membrane protein